MAPKTQKFDVHQEITNRIVDALETAGDFRLPWIKNTGGSFARPVNVASKNPYTTTAAEGFYSTLAHELVHWTGAEKRLARDLSGRFGDESYAIEELVAELGAAFLCADLRITPEPREDHACYIKNWLAILKNDKKAIFTAAAKASQAATWFASQKDSAASAAPLAQSGPEAKPRCLNNVISQQGWFSSRVVPDQSLGSDRCTYQSIDLCRKFRLCDAQPTRKAGKRRAPCAHGSS